MIGVFKYPLFLSPGGAATLTEQGYCGFSLKCAIMFSPMYICMYLGPWYYFDQGIETSLKDF